MKKSGTVLIAFLFLCSMGCTRKQKDDFDNFAKELSGKIPVGSSQAVAENVLDHYGFTHSFDPKTHTIYAIKRGPKSGLIREDWSAKINLGDGQKVDSIKVEKIFTGP